MSLLLVSLLLNQATTSMPTSTKTLCPAPKTKQAELSEDELAKRA